MRRTAQTDLIRKQALEAAASLIEQNAEVTLLTTIAGMQYIVPRKAGDVYGLAYARAIRMLILAGVQQ